MHFTTRIACYGHRQIALEVAHELVTEAGFTALTDRQAERHEFEIERPWDAVMQPPLSFADRVTVKSAPDALVLEADLDGVPRRTMVLSFFVGFTGLMLILANYMWATTSLPLHKVLLPIAPWPVLIPLIHKNMNWMAQRRWREMLRMIGRTASVRAAEQGEQTVQVAPQAPPPEVVDADPVPEPEELHV